MKKGLNIILAAVSSFLLIGLFVIAAAPVWAGSLEERIKALEEEQKANRDELAQLKAEQAGLQGRQIELRQDALAAKAKLPTFRYRPGSGLRITAADKDWRIRFYGRLLTYVSFFDDNDPRTGLAQGALNVRRFRPGFNFEFYKRFAEWKFQATSSSGGSINNFDSELVLHFERWNPWLPFLHFGDSPSVRLNPQDTNCSSKRCGRSERTFVNEGAGVTTGSLDRGIVLGWRKLPLFGPAQISFMNFGYGIDQTNAFNTSSEKELQNDSKTLTLGIGIKPFKKSKNKWIKGLELSFGGRFQKEAETGRDLRLRANQIRFLRVDFIRVKNLTGQEQYYTPGIGWKMGPYQLRVAGQFWRGHVDKGNFEEGKQIRANGFRILHEIWVWSPKGGMLTGSPKKGGLMIAPMYQRGDVFSPVDLDKCSGCRSAHATNSGIGVWYYFGRRVWNVGLVWDHWTVNKAPGGSRGAATVIRDQFAGKPANFNSFTVVSRFHW